MNAPVRYLIVNADDLGYSHGVNRGIFEAHATGVVTSASLMVDTPGSQAAAHGLSQHPGLDVGLHATLTGEAGRLRIDLADAARELERQYQRFVQLTGREPSHIDSHHNIHRDARVREHFLDLASRHGRPLREHSRARYFPSFYGQWDGETHLEQVSVEALLEMLETEVGPGVTELGCHPGYVEPGFASTYAHEREAELRTLCDPQVRARVDELGIRLVSFRDLEALTAAED